MSYSRWSNSAWYSFYNVNGKLSLWYDMDHTIDLAHDELLELMSLDKEIIIELLIAEYNCKETEAIEAIKYIEQFLEEYEPEVGEEYNKEMTEFMAKLEDKKDES
jgi:hypothetical protein